MNTENKELNNTNIEEIEYAAWERGYNFGKIMGKCEESIKNIHKESKAWNEGFNACWKSLLKGAAIGTVLAVGCKVLVYVVSKNQGTGGSE